MKGRRGEKDALIEIAKKSLSHVRRKYRGRTNLDLEWVKKKMECQGRRCAVTGREFEAERKWLRPSIDAIDPSLPHTKKNCQIISLFFQYGKNGLSPSDFKEAIRCLHRGEEPGSLLLYRKPNSGKLDICNPTETVNISRPINMSMKEYSFFQEMEERGGWIRKEEGVPPSLPLLLERGYVKEEEDGRILLCNAREANERRVFSCCVCGDRIPVSELRHRKKENGMGWDLNKCRNMCRRCVTVANVSSKQREEAMFIFNKIRGRIVSDVRGGSLSVEEIRPLCQKRCPVFGIPMRYKSNSGVNQASADRVDNSNGYHPGNVRVVSLFANYARHTLDISDKEMREMMELAFLRLGE